ncbi:MAG: AAA family ATPase [Lachnospiraceae bacterium]|nr:AAA family ATPase [Lachnospiraceae bacterium]
MENDTLIGLVDLIKTCSDIEQSPYGDDNPDQRMEELFMTDLLNFFVMLAYSSGDVHKREIKFINKELKFDFNKDTLKRYAEANVFPIEEFVNQVPVSFQYFVKAEFIRGKTVYNIYRGSSRKYIKTFREAGQEFIAIDGLVSQEEIDNLNAFCVTLEQEVKDVKDKDIYRHYGRRKVSMGGGSEEEDKVEDKKPSLSNVRIYEPGSDYERMSVTGRAEPTVNQDNMGRDLFGGLSGNAASLSSENSGLSAGLSGNAGLSGGGLSGGLSGDGRSNGPKLDPEPSLNLADISHSMEKNQGVNDAYTPNSARLDELLNKLNSMIGLASVKQEVQSLVNKLNISNLRKAQGLPPLPIEMHMVFTGNPGTGKTTVARLLAQIYYEMGILSKGQFVETDRSGLVAGYMGQTAGKVSEVVESALGGVLFIDEAYSLSNGSQEDFGKEAIDTLVKAMEDHRDDLIVIVAGYTKEMQDFIDANPGLQSRFTTYIDFPDYEPFDLVSILIDMCSSMQYVIDPAAVKEIFKTFDYDVSHKDANFGNARDVRNFRKKIIDKQIDRITKEGINSKLDLVTIKPEDVEGQHLGGGIRG